MNQVAGDLERLVARLHARVSRNDNLLPGLDRLARDGHDGVEVRLAGDGVGRVHDAVDQGVDLPVGWVVPQTALQDVRGNVPQVVARILRPLRHMDQQPVRHLARHRRQGCDRRHRPGDGRAARHEAVRLRHAGNAHHHQERGDRPDHAPDEAAGALSRRQTFRG